MWDASEVVREVGVHNFRVITEQQLLRLDDRLLGIAARAIGVLFGGKIGFEDRDWIRLVGLLPERKRQFAEPLLQSIRFDVREVLPISARCALVERHWAYA